MGLDGKLATACCCCCCCNWAPIAVAWAMACAAARAVVQQGRVGRAAHVMGARALLALWQTQCVAWHPCILVAQALGVCHGNMRIASMHTTRTLFRRLPRTLYTHSS